jgi:hypothetical protein
MEQAKTDENVKAIFLKKIHRLFGASNFYKIMELNKDIKEICKFLNTLTQKLCVQCLNLNQLINKLKNKLNLNLRYVYHKLVFYRN